MKRLLPLGLLLAVALLLQPVVGLAAWISQGSSSGSATATSVVKAGAPTVTRSGTTAAISWPQGVLANGLVATGYAVKRTVGTTTTTVCTVAEPTRTCTDTAPVPGTASYVVLSRFNGWTGVASNPTAFVFDTDAPVTTLASNPLANGNGYVTSAPTLTLTATDATTSVASITYKIGSAAAVTVNAATTSFTVSDLGATTVTYAATDVAGNVEGTKTYTVKRDGTAPVTAVSASPAPNAFGYFSSNPTLTLTATDAETSVASVTYKIGAAPPVTVAGSSASFTVTGPATTNVTYFATDAAGNVESTKTYSVKRDATAPTTVTITDPDPGQSYKRNSGNGGWGKTCSSRSGVCATAVDNESSIATMTFRLVSGSTCFNGSAFVSTAGAGTSCDVAMAFDATSNDWFGGVASNALPSNASFSVTVTATNQAGLPKTSAATAFATN